MKIRLLFLLFLLPISIFGQSYTISGQITDTDGTPIPFVSVFVKGSSTGVSANVDGKYLIKVRMTDPILVFSAIGYKSEQVPFKLVNEQLIFNTKLQPEAYTLQDVVISVHAEDPAYRIMRAAIKKRRSYYNEVKNYTADVYIKGMQKLLAAPKKILGRDVQKTLSLDSNRSGILYLSESQSKFSFQKPNQVKEEMISSKVSGRNNTFSFNKASDMLVDFQENLVLKHTGLSSRAFVSPLADNALFYYQYKLLGKTEENGQIINKIQVIPKRKNDPVFSGTLYIAEDSWRLMGLSLYLSKESGINFIDTLHISQNYVDIKPFYMPANLRFEFKGNLFGFKFKGFFVAFYSNYQINQLLPKGYFGSELLKINDTVNRKDSTYWANNRPIPLTEEEKNDYHKKDSIALLRQQKPYLDSLERANNKFTLSKLLLTAYQHNDRFNRRSFTFDPIILSLFYNTVEGAGLKYGITYRKRYEDRRSLMIRPEMRYGFANHLLSANLKSTYVYRPAKRGSFSLAFGSEVLDLNDQGTMSLFSNSLNALIYKRNYPKFYQKNSIALASGYELINGLQASVKFEFAANKSMHNHSLFSFRKDTTRWFTSNNPFDPLNNTALFPNYKSSAIQLNLVYNFGQQFITMPNNKIYIPSKYPQLSLQYRKGIKGFLASQSDYDFIQLAIKKEGIHFGLWGNSSFAMSAGKFLNNKQLYYPDYQHFSGNNAAFFPPSLSKFQYLDFYQYSTAQAYFEAHYEHNFSSFITNKIPLLRKLKLQERIGINYLDQPLKPHYSEIYFGLHHLLFGFSYGFAFDGNKEITRGLRYTYKLSF